MCIILALGKTSQKISNQNSKVFAQSTSWLMGIYHQRRKTTLERQYTFASSDYQSAFDVASTALYGELETALSDNLALIAGIRMEHRTSHYVDNSLLTFNPEDTLWGGRLALQAQMNDKAMAYLSLAKGFKAGGFNTDGSLDEDLREFQSETLLETELGFKSAFYDNRIHLRAAVFYALRRDQQVKSSLLRSRPDGSTELSFHVNSDADIISTQIMLAVWPDYHEYALKELMFSVSLDSTLGDVNSDGVVNILDVVLLVNIILNGDDNPNADINDDGIINILDIVQLVNIILN